nr:N-acetylmuramoyl-L-alanine amidase [Propionibacterium sp.]
MTDGRGTRLLRAVLPLALVALLAGCSAVPSLPGASPAPSASATAPTVTPTVMPSGAFSKPSKGGPTLGPVGDGPLAGKVIVVDPGHNGAFNPAYHNARVSSAIGGTKCMESGTESDEKPAFGEHELNWQVSQFVVTRLLAEGATVILTRPDDEGVGPCNPERAEIANRAGADFFLSVHGDGERLGRNGIADPQGFHVQIEKRIVGGAALYDRSLAAAENMIRQLTAMTEEPLSNYVPRQPPGIWQRTGELAVLAGLETTPGVLVEVGNMKNPANLARLKDPATQDALAAAMVAAIEDTLLKPEFQTPTSKPTPTPTATPSGSASASPSASESPTATASTPGETP